MNDSNTPNKALPEQVPAVINPKDDQKSKDRIGNFVISMFYPFFRCFIYKLRFTSQLPIGYL